MAGIHFFYGMFLRRLQGVTNGYKKGIHACTECGAKEGAFVKIEFANKQEEEKCGDMGEKEEAQDCSNGFLFTIQEDQEEGERDAE